MSEESRKKFLAYKREWYKKNKSLQKEYNDKTRAKNREKFGIAASEGRCKVIEWTENYKRSHPCSKCGFGNIAALHFHHRDPKTKSFTIAAGLWKFSMEKIQAEVAKCDVLCANCHMILEYGNGKMRNVSVPTKTA